MTRFKTSLFFKSLFFKSISIAIFTSLLLIPVDTIAARTGPYYTRDLGTLLSEVALNASAANRTFSLPTNYGIGFGTYILFINYTHNTDGNLDVTCTGGPSATDNDYIPTTCEIVNGVCKVKFGGKILAEGLTTDIKFWGRINITGAKDVECVVTESTPTADDKVEIKGYLVAN